MGVFGQSQALNNIFRQCNKIIHKNLQEVKKTAFS